MIWVCKNTKPTRTSLANWPIMTIISSIATLDLPLLCRTSFKYERKKPGNSVQCFSTFILKCSGQNLNYVLQKIIFSLKERLRMNLIFDNFLIMTWFINNYQDVNDYFTKMLIIIIIIQIDFFLLLLLKFQFMVVEKHW